MRNRHGMLLACVLALMTLPAGAGQPASETMPLGPAPSREGAGERPGEGRLAESLGAGGTLRTVLSLGFVIALALAAGLAMKKVAGTRGGLLSALGPGGPSPSGVLEILGRYPVGAGQTLVLLRLDRRVLLVHQSTGRGGQMRVLSEVVDSDEIASILLKTREERDEAVQAGFREAMHRLETDFSGIEDGSSRVRISNVEGDRAELLDPGGRAGEARSALRRWVEGARA